MLAHLVRFALGEVEAETHIELAFEALRHADAKHRLVHALTRAADLDLAAGRFERARQRALEALAIADRLERPTEAALACICLAECCRQLGDDGGAGRYLQRAAGLPRSSLSAGHELPWTQ